MRAHGVTPELVEEEIVRRVGLGAGAGLFGGLDRDALATIGIDLDAVRARIEMLFNAVSGNPISSKMAGITPLMLMGSVRPSASGSASATVCNIERYGPLRPLCFAKSRSNAARGSPPECCG